MLTDIPYSLCIAKAIHIYRHSNLAIMTQGNYVIVTVRMPVKVAESVERKVQDGYALSKSDYIRTLIRKDAENVLD